MIQSAWWMMRVPGLCSSMARASGEVLPSAAVSRGAAEATRARSGFSATSLYMEARPAGVPSA